MVHDNADSFARHFSWSLHSNMDFTPPILPSISWGSDVSGVLFCICSSYLHWWLFSFCYLDALWHKILFHFALSPMKKGHHFSCLDYVSAVSFREIFSQEERFTLFISLPINLINVVVQLTAKVMETVAFFRVFASIEEINAWQKFVWLSCQIGLIF